MQLGFIGLGIMGLPMARHLIAAGHPLTVFSKTRSKAESLAREAGAGKCSVAATPAELARNSDLIFMMVGDTGHVVEVTLANGGLVEGIRSGAVVANCSTISPSASRRLAEQFAAHAATWLDTPSTGSKGGAEQGTLTFMIGGDPQVFERVRQYFLPMGQKLYYVGKNGMGLSAKLTQNLVLALTYQGVCEGLVLAAKAGVPPKLMYDIIQNSAARAGILEYKAPSIFRGAWDTNFSLKWMLKDISLMLESGHELGVPLPALAVVHELFGASMARGHGDDDYASVITLLEEWAGITVRASD
jgi:3-hydroxyisobutyrate dehydrogenase-like beta-hydroxyacid dehydrogenase